MTNTILLLKRIERFYQLQRQALTHGEISSQLELISKLSAGIASIYDAENAPMLKTRMADGPPSSTDYNDMMNETHEDINRLLVELKQLSVSVENLFLQTYQDRESLAIQLRTLQDNLDVTFSALFQPENEISFYEKFINEENYDKEKIRGTPATITPNESILTLKRLDSIEHREADIQILSNGFPGNTKQIETINNSIKFVGENNPHLDIKSIIDGNSDTWLEYELYTVKETVRQKIGESAFAYHEGFSWIQDEQNPLTLTIILTLKNAKMANWLSLSPLLAISQTTEQPFIKEIIISDGKGLKQIITENQQFGAEHIYMFNRQLCKEITIIIEQEKSYDTTVGCFYYIDSISNQNVFTRKPFVGRRIDGYRHSINLLGLSHDTATQKIIQPKTKENYAAPTMFGKLFEPVESNPQISSGVEAVAAQRQSIGIRDITLASYKFSPESTYISKAYYVANEIKQIKLSANDQTPEKPEETAWLRYFISIDDAATWHPISPEGKTISESKELYIINSGTPAALRKSSYGYIETKSPIHSVRVKIELTRPTETQDSEYQTPIVYEYTLTIAHNKSGR